MSLGLRWDREVIQVAAGRPPAWKLRLENMGEEPVRWTGRPLVVIGSLWRVPADEQILTPGWVTGIPDVLCHHHLGAGASRDVFVALAVSDEALETLPVGEYELRVGLLPQVWPGLLVTEPGRLMIRVV